MKFRTFSDYGSACREIRSYPKFLPTYGYDVDKETGKKERVKNGETNVYQKTQEALPETLVYNILDRVQRTGDLSLLGQAVEGVFDATPYPKDLLEAQCVRVKAEQIFASLPFEERQKYDNNMYEYIRAVNKRMLENVEAAKAKKREEVTTGGADDGDKS